MAWLSAFLEGIKLRARYLWVLAAATALILFLPSPISDWLNLAQVRATLGPVIGVLFVLAILFAGIRTYDAYEERRARRKDEERARLAQNQKEESIRFRLRSLTSPEAKILLDAYRNKQQTVFVPLNGVTPLALVQKGLLEASAPSQAPTMVSSWPHMVPEDVWKLIAENEIVLEEKAKSASR